MGTEHATVLQENAALSRALHDLLLLRYEPIAIKMIEDEADVPGYALNPKRDMDKHMCLCQAYSLARRNKKAVYMDKASEWCWNPLVSFGHVDAGKGTKTFDILSSFIGVKDPAAAEAFFAEMPKLPLGKYKGLVTAPLDGSDFVPDLVLIYANPAQIRMMIGGVKQTTGSLVNTQLDIIDSCTYSTVVPLLTGEYRITFPDPGEYERALSDEDEVILSVPGGRLAELVAGIRQNAEHGLGYQKLHKEMMLDFPRPPFYNELFELWGLEKGKDWDSRA